MLVFFLYYYVNLKKNVFKYYKSINSVSNLRKSHIIPTSLHLTRGICPDTNRRIENTSGNRVSLNLAKLV